MASGRIQTHATVAARGGGLGAWKEKDGRGRGKRGCGVRGGEGGSGNEGGDGKRNVDVVVQTRRNAAIAESQATVSEATFASRAPPPPPRPPGAPGAPGAFFYVIRAAAPLLSMFRSPFPPAFSPL